MRSALYDATVRHTRHRPVAHAFRLRSYYGLFDIDELPELATANRWFSHNRFNLLSFHDSDHGDGRPLGSWVRSLVADAGGTTAIASIRVLTHPRVLGYVFNPISEWYCFDTDEALVAVVHEVHNTFGDTHSYVRIFDGSLAHTTPKHLHVSPFMPMSQRYEFSMTPPDTHLSLSIRVVDDAGEIFRASLSGTRRPFSDPELIRLFVTRPLATLRTIVGIHTQAMRLFLKGVPFFRRPAPPSAPSTHASELEKAQT